MIKFKNVTKTYNNTVKAVNNISLEVKGGEIVGFIGPNGSGKTTTMKLLTGITNADSGKIMVNGYDIRKEPIKAKQSIGYIADSPDMFLRLKGTEFLSLMGDIYHVPLAQRKKVISDLSEKFGLTDVLSSPIMSYSHGMRQKIMVVAALMHNPPVWILDEPMTGLDPKSSYELKNMMREHAKAGNAVFFSTHVLEVAEKLCDRVIIIKKGNILYEGTLDSLESKYENKSLEEIFLELTENETVS
ncbi:MAG: ABC transporter ATP-binding protein [Clostridia bacterium]|nr:ABC transporter ATP-binding protein [Clostridia bacterium]